MPFFYLLVFIVYLLHRNYLQMKKQRYTYDCKQQIQPRLRRKDMKVRIEIEEGLTEEEVVIRCGSLNDSVMNLQNYILKQSGGKRCISLTDKDTDFFIPIQDIYFFETEGRELRAHTADKIFTCSYKLYELEDMLPGNFMRISKSTIANLDDIYSITRNLTASSIVEFVGSRKKALVSRNYYKLLIERLETRKLGR